jgi:hypothetical protein
MEVVTIEQAHQIRIDMENHLEWHYNNGIHGMFEIGCLLKNIEALQNAQIGDHIDIGVSHHDYSYITRYISIGFSPWSPKQEEKPKTKINFKDLRKKALTRDLTTLTKKQREFVETGNGTTGMRSWFLTWIKE